MSERYGSLRLAAGLALCAWLPSGVAQADSPAPSPSGPPPAPSSPAQTAALPMGTPVLQLGQHFVFDPVADGALTAAGFGFSFLLGEVLGTGEIRPPEPSVPVSSLLPIDRIAVTQTIDPHASTYSDIGLYTAIGFAVLDPVLSGFRDGWDALIVDGFMYAESGSLALMLTDVTKIAVRRPRPIDYKDCPIQSNGEPSANPGCTASTDLGLSFFSGHAASVAAIGATATYLAFVRSPHSPRPWITLGVSTALTTFVSVERVRAGMHFPTDVIAGAMAGAAVGVLVPHLHRHVQEAPPVWVGVSPLPGGGSLALQGFF